MIPITPRVRGAVNLVALGAALAACGAPPSTPAAASPATQTEPVAPSPTPPTPVPIATASAAPSPPLPVEAKPVSPVATVKLGAWKRVLEEPVTSLALGEPRVAVLAADPWIFEQGAWKKIALPDRVRPAAGERDDGRIFFGRDDRPRIMGVRHRAGGPAQLYLRYRNGRWAEERNEIAKLRDPPPQAMFGLLGHADPEVVCKLGDDCIIKRRTGWKMIKAGDTPFRVELHGGVAWALLADAVARLDDDKVWKRFAPPGGLSEPSGVWAKGEEVWIVEAKTGSLHHLRGGVWAKHPSPTPEPRAMWGAAANDLWLAGATGLCHFDGTTWARVEGPSGPLVEVYGRDGEVWAAGAAGVWMSGPMTR